MIQPFVNIVAESCMNGMWSVHRLDVSKHLFYPSTAHAQANNAAATGGMTTDRLQELPAACIRIPPAPTTAVGSSRRAFFGLVSPSSSEGRILYVDKAGNSLLYDADAPDTISIVPSLDRDKRLKPILVSVVAAAPPDAQNHRLEDLYVMARAPGRGSFFDVLRLSGGARRPEWQALPPPLPFVGTYDPATICSHTVVNGGRSICVSFSEGVGTDGTYCFDTVEGAWRQVADWMLPFDGGAEYASDLNLWLGFSHESPHHLCWTSELSVSAMVMADRPPELQGTLEDLVVPENWSPTTLRLINLGSGRFCVAKLFVVKRDTWGSGYYYDHWGIESEIAVFTGVEIARGAQGPFVLKHKSILYQIVDDVIQWVL